MMHYQYGFELCALLFLILLTTRFFGVRQFPNRENKLFGIALYFATADLLLDMIGSFMIEHPDKVPIWINYLTNTIFYLLQTVFPAVLLSYLLIVAGEFVRHKRLRYILLTPAVMCAALVIINPLTGWIFRIPRVNGILVYTRGPLFNSLYLGTAFYIIAVILFTWQYRNKVQRKQSWTFFMLALFITASAGLQYIFPEYLLTGVAIAIAMQMMYYTLQNPENMLDLISGTFNYGGLIIYLRSLLAEGLPFGVVAVDVGGIRRVNSAFGMQTGNAVLERVGMFLNNFRNRGWAFRMVGTRFLLVTGSDADHQELIHQVERRFGMPWKADGIGLMLTATIRSFNEPGFFTTPEDIVNLIDIAYAEIGSGGWGTSKPIDNSLLQQIHRKTRVEEVLRDAFRSGEGFKIYYQPIYSPTKRRFIGAEALLRLYHPDLGAISPSEFIPVAEKAGLISEIDEAVIREVCKFLKRYGKQLQGLEQMNINLSAADFFRNWSQRAHQVVLESSVSPDCLRFEVTETAATIHQNILAEFMRDMIGYGYQFSLDDFGTGYANITQVIQLPFSSVKLDRTMLVADEEQNRILFDGMLRMLKDMGLATVVEGVETGEQARRVCDLGADHVQGYYYARPMPETDFLRFMAKQGECAGVE